MSQDRLKAAIPAQPARPLVASIERLTSSNSNGLDPEALADCLEAVARRSAELAVEIAREAPVAARPLTTADVAREVGRSQEWVREHRELLGVLPVEGERPRLLFDAAKVREYVTAGSTGWRSQVPESRRAKPKRQRHAARVNGHPDRVLPIRGNGGPS